MTGIGINIREASDNIGGVKLKVQGLILDGPAHTAGVRQVEKICSMQILLALVNVSVGAKSLFCFLLIYLQGKKGFLICFLARFGAIFPLFSYQSTVFYEYISAWPRHSYTLLNCFLESKWEEWFSLKE